MGHKWRKIQWVGSMCDNIVFVSPNQSPKRISNMTYCVHSLPWSNVHGFNFNCWKTNKKTIVNLKAIIMALDWPASVCVFFCSVLLLLLSLSNVGRKLKWFGYTTLAIAISQQNKICSCQMDTNKQTSNKQTNLWWCLWCCCFLLRFSSITTFHWKFCINHFFVFH